MSAPLLHLSGVGKDYAKIAQLLRDIRDEVRALRMKLERRAA